MAVTRTLFRAIAHGEVTVSAAIERMNAELARDNERQFFVTAIVGRIDLGSGVLTFCNAAQGVALGVVEDAVYAETSVTIARGEVLLLFTDGVTEAVNSGELFSDSRLLREFANAPARLHATSSTTSSRRSTRSPAAPRRKMTSPFSRSVTSGHRKRRRLDPDSDSDCDH